MSADDAQVVAGAKARAAPAFAAVAAPPERHRHHSGLTRPPKQLELEKRQGVDFGHGDVLGPLVDLLLLASAQTFVGTAGSSFSEQALSWGAFDRVDPASPRRAARLFVTPFAKSRGGAVVGGRTVATNDLPASADAAKALCATGGGDHRLCATKSVGDRVICPDG